MNIWDICEGNPGALTFVAGMFDTSPIKAEKACLRMWSNCITGSRLYMLWNDCCDRDTRLALQIALEAPIDEIKRHINYDGGRGFAFTEDELCRFVLNYSRHLPS